MKLMVRPCSRRHWDGDEVTYARVLIDKMPASFILAGIFDSINQRILLRLFTDNTHININDPRGDLFPGVVQCIFSGALSHRLA